VTKDTALTEHCDLINKEFGHLGEGYFNSAYFGPSPQSARKYVTEALDREIDPRTCLAYDKLFFEFPNSIRAQFAELLGCDPNLVCLNTASSDMVSAIAHGIQLEKDDVVVSFKGEFPSNVLPWMVAEKNRGLNFKLLDHPLPTAEWLSKELPAKTKVVNVSHVAFDTGRKINLIEIGKLLRQRDILFIVDATQSLGGLEISKEELSFIDVVTCSTYKWMLGPYGAAFTYLNQRALDMIQHQTGNWISSPNSKGGKSLSNYTIQTLEGARRFDRGQAPNMLINSCLAASFGLLKTLGLKNIGEHNKAMRNYFLDIMPKKKYQIKTPTESMGNILSIGAPNMDLDALNKNLKDQNVEAGIREGNIRLSFHLFNTKSHVESLVKALDK
jgi:selenocysteine lyase/cysteine desulfurase